MSPNSEILETEMFDLFLSSPGTRSKKRIANRTSVAPGIKI
ncbi:hypothetical protein LINPERPRIM_LOCUS32914 [Linum perenne]